ncbi:hypothetical protein EJ08DRAFT_640315 [Tothia fuscella]|uniref:Small ribosomal subunit protein mS33 n=1 Tax=Tothia fuscella TaxID=1048955 RepID=A0A9P4TUQ8_9PEZI|nr:hypothetical protein EJ08DRAFT_640315 [Tothia fuscella]
MSVPRARILALLKTQCTIFNTTYNPNRLRLGNKILRQRLKGPSITNYYPPRIRVVQELKKAYPDWEVEDEKEDERVEGLKIKRQRGKGAPKKRRTAAESKKLLKRRPGQARPAAATPAA